MIGDLVTILDIAAVVCRVDRVKSSLKANDSEQSNSHEDECIGSNAIVLDELLKAVLTLEDFLLILAREDHLLAVILPIHRVLVVEVYLLHLFDDLDDVVSESQSSDALLQTEGVLVLQCAFNVVDVREWREDSRD